MPEKFKGKKTEKAGVVVEEEHLLSFIDVCDDNVILDTCASMMYMQVDIQQAYLFATIDYGFENVTEAPTECDYEDKVSELKTSCASEA